MSSYVYIINRYDGEGYYEPVFASTRKYQAASFMTHTDIPHIDLFGYRLRDGLPETVVDLDLSELVRRDQGEL